ncbi:MAG TPA: 3-deoxy-manno-octulosonate cytidylyltransferase, partial [Usitatibacter sp.]|nr:3-deoxy-manno-octulosonate cytidylyltransferase [Usitatibacter sp.]
VPARYGSTRLPGKALLPLAGKPLIQWVYERARRSGAQQVIIATDDERIAHTARSFGAEVRMTAATHASGTDRIAEVARREQWRDADIVVNVQGDEPLIDPALIRKVAEELALRPHASIATAVHPITTAEQFFDPNVVKVVFDTEGYAQYFSRAPIPYAREAFSRSPTLLPEGLPAFRHIGIYAYRVRFLREYSSLSPTAAERFEALEQLRALGHGHRIALAFWNGPLEAGVDTHDDLERVRRKLGHSL